MSKALGLDLGTRTLGIAESDSAGWYAYGIETFRFNEGNYKDALFYFNKAINCPISERSYYAYYNLAKIYKSGNKKLNISKNEKLYNKYMNIFQNKKES